jgi:uncharacterized NAD-dependent epimerase/dehydratase family protein
MNKNNQAVVYCEGAFNTPNGKTAHGLVRFTNRYSVIAVVDSRYTNQDAGEVLDGRKNHIPIFASVKDALSDRKINSGNPRYFVIGVAPDGGRMNPEIKKDIHQAIRANLDIHSGLHDYLTDDIEIVNLAKKHGVQLLDIRKPPERSELHFFSGKIEQVKALKVAVLGTDSAIGKRTSAWILTEALNKKGYKTEFIGTGQTAWMQGARYGIMLDAIVNDFLTGEIEHAVWKAWHKTKPDIIVVEGQGSLMNPAYPGGYEILAAARPDLVILQHAPARKEYDGFPGYPIHPLPKQIQAIELISGKPVIAITINHENLNDKQLSKEIHRIEDTTGLPAFDLLKNGAEALSLVVIAEIKNWLKSD